MQKSDVFLGILLIFGAGYMLYNWLKKAWQKVNNRHGVQYAAANPHFKVDTDRLRNYATRLSSVNKRLNTLDGNLNGLYLQVGLLDILDILVANILISESRSLNQAISYLNDAASRFEAADNNARGYVGG